MRGFGVVLHGLWSTKCEREVTELDKLQVMVGWNDGINWLIS